MKQRSERMQAVLRRAFEQTERAEVSSRAELRERLDGALDEAGVAFVPVPRDLWVRTQWARRGPRWARGPRLVWAQVHSVGAGLRGVIRFAWQAPPEDAAEKRLNEDLRRLPGGVYTDSDFRIPTVGALAAIVLAVSARRSSGPVRRGLSLAAILAALPAALLVLVGGVFGLLIWAFRGWAAERSDDDSWRALLPPEDET